MDKYTKLNNQLLALEKEKYKQGGVLPRFKRYYYTWLLLTRNRLAKKINPIVKVEQNNQEIEMQLANNIPLFKARYRSYDKPIMIISKWIYEQKQRLNFVDVGANVGDTVVNIGIKEGNYLEIEGDERYFDCLVRNLENYHYKLVNCFLTDYLIPQQEVNVVYTLGHVLEKVDKDMQTLDNILDEMKFDADIIKSDTDGYDLKVIRGGMNYIKTKHPFLFVEWHPKWLIENNQENPLELFKIMSDAGYQKCILFDNYGTIQAVLDTEDVLNFKVFEKYCLNEEKQVCYYDICFIPSAIHNLDSLIDNLINWERYC
ncbi:MAG: FkbM family methyltransferase [Roseburia sp.]|nr:FkbM family methyltransferase [Roseburia sp.]